MTLTLATNGSRHGLGRRPLPEDDPMVHLRKYAAADTLEVPDSVEKVLKLPYRYRVPYDQKRTNGCVGYAWTWAKSILDNVRYDADWLYAEARKIDEWPGEADEGTSVRAGGQALLDLGHLQVHDPRHDHVPEIRHGIDRFRWANTEDPRAGVDDIRAAIFAGLPVVLGIDWLRSFSVPVLKGREYWIGDRDVPGDVIDGGHAICLYGWSDRRDAGKLTNSWGGDYPLVWLPSRKLEDLLAGLSRWPGEAAIPTDR